MTHDTLASLLAQRIRTDAGSPFVTYYDLDSGERTELSAVTFGNWVDKTAGFARDELDLQTGDRVRIALPLHWQTLVWWAACARAGVVITEDDSTDAWIVGPDDTEWSVALEQGAGRIAALSLQPWGRGFASPPHAPVIDFADQVRLFPDVFAESMPSAHNPVVEIRGAIIDQGELVEAGNQSVVGRAVVASARLLVADKPVEGLSLDKSIATLLAAPLIAGASLVLVRNAHADGLSTIEAQELTTAQLTNPLN